MCGERGKFSIGLLTEKTRRKKVGGTHGLEEKNKGEGGRGRGREESVAREREGETNRKGRS